jgi:hypothetical protein
MSSRTASSSRQSPMSDALSAFDDLGLTLARRDEDGVEWTSPGVVITLARDAEGDVIGTIRRRGSRVAVALDELVGGEVPPAAWAEYLRTHPAALRGDRKVFAPLEGRSRDRSRLGAQAGGLTGPPPRRDRLK